MDRKGFAPLIIIGVIAIFTIAGVAGYFVWEKSLSTQESQIQIEATSSKNARFAEVARSYISSQNPQIYFDGQFVSIADPKVKKIGFTPSWFMNHEPGSIPTYVPPGKYQPPYDYLNNTYSVGWTFMPGCEKNLMSSASPNWFTPEGTQCLGGWDVNVIFDKNMHPFRIMISSIS